MQEIDENVGTKVKQREQSSATVFSAITQTQTQTNNNNNLNESNNNNNDTRQNNSENNNNNNNSNNENNDQKSASSFLNNNDIETDYRSVDTFFSIKQISKVSAYLNNEQSKSMRGQTTCMAV